MKSPAITVNFLNEIDKIETQNIFKNISNKTGEVHPVILNKALRFYLRKVNEEKKFIGDK